MVFKLDKKEIARRDEIFATLNETSSKLEDAVSTYNAEMANLRIPLDAALAAYNEAVAEAQSFAEDIVNQADSDISDKSERWQEGERGEEATSWKDEWEGASFDEVEIEYPDDLEIGDLDHAATLEQLPEAAG